MSDLKLNHPLPVPSTTFPQAKPTTPTEIFSPLDGRLLDEAVNNVNRALRELGCNRDIHNTLRFPCDVLGVPPRWRALVIAQFEAHWYVQYVAEQDVGEFYEFTAIEKTRAVVRLTTKPAKSTRLKRNKPTRTNKPERTTETPSGVN
jgi:hypothetical protein